MNFADLPTLISESWRRRRAQMRGDREQLARAKAKRTKHKPSKAHSTNRERSYEQRAKASRIARAAAQAAEERQAYLEAARAYWAGTRDGHP